MKPTHPSAFTLLACIFIMLLTGCTAFDALNGIVPTCCYHKNLGLSYGPLPRQKLDIYRPFGNQNADVVIFFYGGHWQSGDRADYRFVAQALTSRGFLTVIPDYRVYPQVQFPTFVQDGAAAFRWVHDNISQFGGNPNRIYLMGHSAGAHIVALLTLDKHYLKDVGLNRDAIHATAALSGPYDFIPPNKDRGVFGMTASDRWPNPDAEPIGFIDGHAPPLLLIHGLKDKTVEPGNATRLAKAIQEKGGQVQLNTYPNRAHVDIVLALAFPFRWFDPILDDAARFFHQH